MSFCPLQALAKTFESFLHGRMETLLTGGQRNPLYIDPITGKMEANAKPAGMASADLTRDAIDAVAGGKDVDPTSANAALTRMLMTTIKSAQSAGVAVPVAAGGSVAAALARTAVASGGRQGGEAGPMNSSKAMDIVGPSLLRELFKHRADKKVKDVLDGQAPTPRGAAPDSARSESADGASAQKPGTPKPRPPDQPATPATAAKGSGTANRVYLHPNYSRSLCELTIVWFLIPPPLQLGDAPPRASCSSLVSTPPSHSIHSRGLPSSRVSSSRSSNQTLHWGPSLRAVTLHPHRSWSRLCAGLRQR